MADSHKDEAEDEVKRKFREALDRKSKASHAGSSHTGGTGSAAQGEHAAAGGKRQFRRKSGG